MPLEWERLQVLPAELVQQFPGARIIEADAEDGVGKLRAILTVQRGIKAIEVVYHVDPEGEPDARWPTLEEVYSALGELVPDGSIIQIQLPTGPQFRDPPPGTKNYALAMIVVARLAPQFGEGGGNGKRIIERP